MGLRTGPGSGSAERLAGQNARPEEGEPGCLTRLAQHVGKADISADCWVQLHPGGHGVQLPCLVQLIQEGLSRERPVTGRVRKGGRQSQRLGKKTRAGRERQGQPRLRKCRQEAEMKRYRWGGREQCESRECKTEGDRLKMKMSRTGRQRSGNLPAALSSHDLVSTSQMCYSQVTPTTTNTNAKIGRAHV